MEVTEWNTITDVCCMLFGTKITSSGLVTMLHKVFAVVHMFGYGDTIVEKDLHVLARFSKPFKRKQSF